jgi:hypothetical protein
VSEKDLESYAETTQTLGEDITDSLEEFVTQFVANLVGVSSVDAKKINLSLDSKVGQIINVAINEGTPESSFLAGINLEGMASIKDFAVTKHTIDDIYNALSEKGRIRKTATGELILLDAHGNLVDETGKVTGRPTSIKATDKDVSSKLYRYLYSNRNIAMALFSVSVPPIDAKGVLQDINSKIKLVNDNENYDFDGIITDRATHFITTNFSSEFDTERAIITSIYNEKINEFKDDHAGDEYTPEKMNAESATFAFKFVKDKDEEYETRYAQ